MKASILVGFLAVIAAQAHTFSPGLRARFDYGFTIGSTFFYDIPKTKTEAESLGWLLKDRPEGPMEQLELLCYEDCVFCSLYDDLGHVVGVQVGIREDLYTDALYDWNDQGFTYWNTTVNGTATYFWTNTMYFIKEELLELSQEERMTRWSASNETLFEGYVMATGFDKNLTQINSNATDMTSNNTIFTKQGCVPWMGYHYYYNMSSTTECTSTTLYPWFPLVQCDQVIALGLATYGKLNTTSGQRNWFERPPLTFVEISVPNGPQCVYDSAVQPGLLTIHVYFIDEPWRITCFDFFDCLF